jgi:hypothetical protein
MAGTGLLGGSEGQSTIKMGCFAMKNQMAILCSALALRIKQLFTLIAEKIQKPANSTQPYRQSQKGQ